ncbi:PH domain-containing protein [Prosthecobacter sp.]|uniref:PH domain-containing protein n=1 Tax=Prosthecobacter sp. TaxID=1965333 RepID=UPI003784BCF8
MTRAARLCFFGSDLAFLMSARYRLQQHPAFSEPLSREDLYTLVARGSLARGEMCVDEATGFTHTVGELVSGMRQPSAIGGKARITRPAYREFSPDTEIPEEEIAEEEEDEEIEGEEDPEEDPDALEEKAKKDRDFSPSGEVILHHAHPSWFGYTKALVLCILLTIAGGLLFIIQFEYSIIAFLCASSTLIAIGISRYSHDYIVTRERVELIWGIIGKSSKEARICDIRSIDVYESGIKGLLGLGTIDFSTAANAGIEVQFKDLRRAHVVKDLVRKLQRGADPTND